MWNGQLLERISKIHFSCQKLCQEAIGHPLPIAGNIGIFCQDDREYSNFDFLRKELTDLSENPKQKYFKLKEPVIFPEAKYTYLYIRKPDQSPYGKNLGDVDFILEQDEYNKLKEKVLSGEVENAEVYKRPGWDMVQLSDPQINSIAYVSTMQMAEKVRVRFD